MLEPETLITSADLVGIHHPLICDEVFHLFICHTGTDWGEQRPLFLFFLLSSCNLISGSRADAGPHSSSACLMAEELVAEDANARCEAWIGTEGGHRETVEEAETRGENANASRACAILPLQSFWVKANWVIWWLKWHDITVTLSSQPNDFHVKFNKAKGKWNK